MLAVLEVSGKQYLVREGDKIITNNLNKNPGEEVFFDKVLLLVKDNKVEIGTPYLKNYTIQGKVLKNLKKKILIIKYKPKTRYRKKKGYKNYFNEILIEKIAAA